MDHLEDGDAALKAGRWEQARACFTSALARAESADACFGLAVALWWLGDNRACVDQGARAYLLYRKAGLVPKAVQCAVWLAITYKANFANFAAANGWLRRAERLLAPVEEGPGHAWVWIARAYRMPDLAAAEALTAQALDIATTAGDIDLELVAMAQLGLIRVGRGQVDDGFALIDEAMAAALAAALAGERTGLDTVVYACCDMLNACELVSDLDRAAQWCAVADGFLELYGCPFLYAECRMFYGSVLVARGRWEHAERELAASLRITADTCPGLHNRALVRLADLRIRQGRLEEAERLLAGLGVGVEAESEETLAIAALQLARGDAQAARRTLERRLDRLAGHRLHLAAALDLLVDAYVAAGDRQGATAALTRLTGADSPMVLAARGRVALMAADPRDGIEHLELALKTSSRGDFPFEAARIRLDLALALAGRDAEAAIDHGRRALSGFASLGAARHADQAAAFLRSHGVTPRTGHRGEGTLTAREWEVLRLLATGLSNPEVALRLHISRKTAAHHVSNILAKLELRNRAEAAAWVTARPPDG